MGNQNRRQDPGMVRLSTSPIFGIAVGLALGIAASFQIARAQAPEEPASAAEESPQAASVSPREYEISGGELGAALDQFADQSDLQIIYDADLVAGQTAPAVSGRYRPSEILRELLTGSGLEWSFVNERTLVLRRAPSATGSGNGPQPGIEEIIVTGQKREERIQDVPIAISAFSPEDLEAQKIEGGFDLLKGVPNVTFSKTNFSGYNFQIRGIGTQAVSATTDPAVAVSFNNTTLIVNRLFEQEYLDVERVEVLRGPQGTLFGRNATAGVINVISKKPELGVWDSMIDVEVGNHNARRLRGFFNAPIGDTLAIRGAYASTKRDGFGINEAASDPLADVSRDVDDRDLWTGRFTIGWQPNDRFRANLLWERFEEDDSRVRTSKQLCHRDPGEEQLGSQSFDDAFGVDHAAVEFLKGNFSQGCLPGSLYSDDAYGTPNGTSLPYIASLYFSVDVGAWGFANGDGLHLPSNIAPLWGLGANPYQENLAAAPCPQAVQQANLGVPETFFPIDVCNPDPYRGKMQSRDLRTIESLIQPQYKAGADIVELSWDLELTDNLLLSSQSVYVNDEYSATQDFNRFNTSPVWQDSTIACSRFNFLGIITVPDCTEPGEELLLFGSFPTGQTEGGRGTFAPLTDADGDGIVDQTNYPLNEDPLRQQTGTYSVDGDGFVRDEEGSRVGFYRDLTPDGVLCDPQLGCSRSLVGQDLSRVTATQYNQEFRLVSSYSGDWNFSLGANYTKFRTLNDYFVFINGLTHLLNFFPFNAYSSLCAREGEFCRFVDPSPLQDIVDGRASGEGHNYFRSANPYELTSWATFGELYWNATETVKFTLGLRFTWDKKVFTPVPSQLLLANFAEVPFIPEGTSPFDIRQGTNATEGTVGCGPALCPLAGTAPGGRGSPSSPDIVQVWREPTGRLVVDWSPVLGFTDETMIYASFSHGYKGGGANPPSVDVPAKFTLDLGSGGFPDTFEPEFINAYEVGTKNTLFGGALVLNGTAFYYDYTDYQVSQIVDRRAVNENFDAEVWGLELETIFAPSLNWQFNAAIGFLNTEIADGEQSIDLMDRTQGGNRHFAADPDALSLPFFGPGGIIRQTTDFPEGFDDWTVMKPFLTAASNCVVPTELVEANLRSFAEINSGSFFTAYCPTGNLAGFGGDGFTVAYIDENGDLVPSTESDRAYNPSIDAPNGGSGFFADLSGNELPQAPQFTVALGAQYNFDLTRDWRATARVDYYWQDESFARVYNTEYDRLKSWSNTNLSFWINNPNTGITVEGYVKNVFDETPITGSFLNSDDAGLTTNVFTLDPRLIGVSVRKEF